MLDQLAEARRIVEDGEETTPAWRIETTEGACLILTRFDTDNPEQRARAMTLIGRQFHAHGGNLARARSHTVWRLAVGISHTSAWPSSNESGAATLSASASLCGSPRTTSATSASRCCQRARPKSLLRKRSNWRIFGRTGELRAERLGYHA